MALPSNQIAITQNLDSLRRQANTALANITNRWSVSAFGPYGTSDDTATWVAALASGEPLFMPPGVSKVSSLALPNNCSVEGVRGKSILSSLPHGLPLLTLSDAYNTFVTLRDIILLGNAGTQPITGTHRGLYLVNAFSGINDALYSANNPTGAQVPDHSIRVDVAGFNDEGVYLAGAGGSEFQLTVRNCGVGVYCNSYDVRFTNPDVGSMTYEGWIFDGNGSVIEVTGGKTWFAGNGQVSGRASGIKFNNCAMVRVSGHTIQDCAGSSILFIGGNSSENACYFSGILNRQATLNWFDPATTADVDIRGSSANVIDAVAVWQNGCTQPTFIAQNVANGGVPTGVGNIVRLSLSGYAQPTPSALLQIGGTWDGNTLQVGSYARAPSWLPNDSGDVVFAVNMNGSSTGLVARGPASIASVGQLVMIGQSGGGTALGYATTAVSATGVLTFASNVVANDTVTIGGTAYTFVASVNNTVANQVKVGATQAASIANLHHAINRAGGTPGTDWSLRTTANPNVTATDNGVNTVTVTASATGTGGNAIATTTTSAHCSWGGATLSGGANGAQTYTSSFSWTQTGMSSRSYLQASTTYANDAAAAAGGVPVGGEYRNASAEQVRIA